MIFPPRNSLLRRCIPLSVALILPLLLAASQIRAHAQRPSSTVQALFVSDIHFEPFWDPSKVAKLAAAPVASWPRILSSPASANRQQAFDTLQTSCHTRGTDTAYPVFRSSMAAIHAHSAGVKFITLSGDLMAHGFDCKFKTVVPHASAADYRTFAVKTIRFVISQLQVAAPGVPVYTALGNNDSDCGDYKIDANSAFLKQVGAAVAERFPAKERTATLASFAQNGSYSVMLPPPLENTRLIALDDVFFSAKHSTCSGKPDAADQNAEYAWLATQLNEAEHAHQKTWVMAHIPPGLDAYATLAHLSGPCGRAPKMLLSSGRLAQTLEASSDSIKLAIFGHTHEDEISLLRSDQDNRQPQHDAASIPAKLVAAISPINGNLPSFTVAQIDTATATLVDYEVIAGSDKIRWHQQYDYQTAYAENTFSAEGVQDLLRKFTADHDSKTHPSQSYIHNFSIGNPIPMLSLVWAGYVCTMAHQTAEGFSACACSEQPQSGNSR